MAGGAGAPTRATAPSPISASRRCQARTHRGHRYDVTAIVATSTASPAMVCGDRLDDGDGGDQPPGLPHDAHRGSDAKELRDRHEARREEDPRDGPPAQHRVEPGGPGAHQPRLTGQERGSPLDTDGFAGHRLEQGAVDQDRPAAGRGDSGGRSAGADPDVHQGRTQPVRAQHRECRCKGLLVRHGQRRRPVEQTHRQRLHAFDHQCPSDDQPRREQGEARNRRQQRTHRTRHTGRRQHRHADSTRLRPRQPAVLQGRQDHRPRRRVRCRAHHCPLPCIGRCHRVFGLAVLGRDQCRRTNRHNWFSGPQGRSGAVVQG